MHILHMHIPCECSCDTPKGLLGKVLFNMLNSSAQLTGATFPAPTVPPSCSLTFSWHSFSCSCVAMEESIQLKGNQIFAGLAFNCTLFAIQFTIPPQKHTSCQKVVCVQNDRGITSELWMQEWLTQPLLNHKPKDIVAAWIGRSSGKEKLSQGIH